MDKARKKKVLRIFLISITACMIYGFSGGVRANYGVMLDAISTMSSVSYASISFVMAVAQLIVGIVQPIFGVVTLRKENSFVLGIRAVILAPHSC